MPSTKSRKNHSKRQPTNRRTRKNNGYISKAELQKYINNEPQAFIHKKSLINKIMRSNGKLEHPYNRNKEIETKTYDLNYVDGRHEKTTHTTRKRFDKVGNLEKQVYIRDFQITSP